MTPPYDAEKKARELLTLLEDQDGYSYCNVELIAQALRDARIEAIEQNAIFRKHLEELIEIQKRQGDDPYMVGMANGLICALSCYTGNEPEYVSKPKDGGK